MKTKDTDTTMITSTEKATDKVARAFYSSMDEMLAHDFEDMKKIATTPTKKTPAYADPRQALRDIEEHSKTPQDVIAELDAEEAAEKAEQLNNHSISEVTIFSDNLHPEFGNLRGLTIDGEPWFSGKDVAAALGYKDTKKAIKAHVADEDKTLIQRGQNTPIENHLPKSVFPFNFVDANIPTRGMIIINESGLYSLILSSKLEKAKAFKHWVTAEVLPTIRKTGGYINQGQEDLFIDTYMPFLDENYKNLFKLNLQALDQQNKTIRKQKVIIETQKQDIKDFQEALDAYTKDVPLATKRMLINRLIRFPGTNFGLRWMVLYREFDNVYHMNVKARMNKYNVTHTPMCKSQMEFIDLHLGMINELFDLAVKLFKSDYEALIQQMYDAREIDFDSINLN